MNPQYSDAYLAEFYAGYIAASDGRDDPARVARRTRAKEAHIADVERFVRPGRFLAVGVGDGIELDVARRRGWEVVGYDVDPETTASVARRTGATVWSGDLLALDIPPASFDAVFMDQVLEHPKNPGAYLQLCRRILRPGGVLYLGVPNIDSISSRWQTVLGRLGLKRRRGRHYDSWHHLFYYGPASLGRVLERHHGFEVLLVQGDPGPREDGAPGRAAAGALRRRFPNLDSSLRLIARPR
jgi:SAM-dependent methyltransferase